jgi:hypothetical protein
MAAVEFAGRAGEDGHRLTPKAVASALHTGREKIREALRKKGYQP